MSKQKKAPITPLEVRQRIKEIKDKLVIRDYGAAASLENKLYGEILYAAAAEHPDSATMARAALKVWKMQFPRNHD